MKNIITTLLLLFLAGCQTIYSRGQFVDDAQVDQLMNKKMSQNEVIRMLGTPTLVPDYTENTWYYAQRSLSYRAWFTPKIVSQRVVKISFNKNKQISEVEVFNDKHSDDIVISEEYTKSVGTEKNYLQNFVKNFGKFNKSKKHKKKQR